MSQQAYVFPLSFAQQRLWFLDQLVPANPFYNVAAAVRLETAIDAVALERAVNEIVRRHEALRTTFRAVEGRPVQVVAPVLELALPVLDLAALPRAEREREALRLATEEAQRPFDLARGPLVRTSLLRLGPREHVFLLTLHHIVSDGWSMGVLSRELNALYGAFARGAPSPLPELPIQYADFALWQRRALAGEALERQLAYWRARLAGAPTLALPTDRPRPPVARFRGASASLALPAELGVRLRRLAQAEGATLFMVLLCAFKALLSRYTGQEDIVVGAPIANRTRPELEGLIGFFVNTLVLRTDLGANPSFREALARVRDGCLGAYAHQDIPFERLVDELAPERDLSRNPLFQVTFQLQHARPGEGAPEATLEVERGASIFDLALNFADGPAGLTGIIEYNTDLFDEATIVRLARHYETLLAGAVADPECPLARLPLLTPAERHTLLEEWNRTDVPLPEAPVHALVAAQARRTPAAPALRAGERVLSYRELEESANRLAHRLRAAGVGRDVPVALCLPRSPELVVAMLAVLKAGGAYLPLDPAYPRARLAFMLEDAGAPVLLTTAALAPALPPGPETVILLDRAEAELARYPAGDPGADVRAGDLAYVIYTSGSTGTPKGVMATHRGAVNRIRWTWEAYPFKPGEVVCQKTPVSFVDSVWEIFGPLASGVPLVIVPDEDAQDPYRLIDALERHRVTRIVLVPSLLRALLDTDVALDERLRLVHHWTSSGEELPVELVHRFWERVPHGRLINLYGSSEVAADATCFDTQEGVADVVPMGRPIANTQVYVLDSRRRPVPVGVTGEVYVAGAGLAKGYLNAPALTAGRFVANPLGGSAHERLYRTGDLACYLPDGNLVFLGRADNQVKIAGHRIELGEVEAVLGSHQSVSEAAVLHSDDADPRLVAYVVAAREPAPEADDLRAFALERLPAQAVPSAFVLVVRLPLTPAGKIDRRALLAFHGRAPKREHSLAEPRNALETVLAGLFSEVLRVDQVGIHDDFFRSLGGHSLLAMRLVSQVRSTLNAEIGVRELFQAPTVAGLAAALERDASAAGAARKTAEALVAVSGLSDDEVEQMLAERART
jgi:amino acid adenylation domain-containing protein